MECPDRDKWKLAAKEEKGSLDQKKTFRVVSRPADRNVIKCKWVFKVKPAYDGVAERYKAKLVATLKNLEWTTPRLMHQL
jgi:hypothetical protein